MIGTRSFYGNGLVPRAHALTAIHLVLSIAAFQASAFAQNSENDTRTASEAFGVDTLALLDAGQLKGEAINDAGTTMTTPSLLSAFPTTLDFGDFEVGFTTTRMLTLSNDGGGTVDGSVSVAPPFTLADGGDFSLGPGEIHELTVGFAPSFRGTFFELLSFVVGEVIELDVSVNARGVAPVLFADPPLLDFRVVQQGQSRSQVIRIANIGELVLDGEAQVLPPFFFPEDSGRYSLGEGESILLPVEFRPVEVGAQGAAIQLVGSQSGAITIRGQSAAPIGQFRGQVIDRLNGLPIVCTAIQIRNANGFETVVTSDSSGVFVTEEIPQGSYELTVYAPGYERPTFALALDQGLVERRFELQPRAEDRALRGVLGDAFSGALLGGVKVTVLQDGEEVATAYSCAKGSFEFRLLDRDRPIALAFAAPGYDTGAVQTVIEPPFDRTLSFVLMPEGAAAAEIFGTITDRGTGDRLSMAVITATRLGIARTIFSTNDGSFELSGIASGYYRVRVSAAGHLAENDMEVTVFGADPSEALDVDLVSGLDEVDAPPANADPTPTGCSAGTVGGDSAPWDFALVLAAIALFSLHGRRTRI